MELGESESLIDYFNDYNNSCVRSSYIDKITPNLRFEVHKAFGQDFSFMRALKTVIYRGRFLDFSTIGEMKLFFGGKLYTNKRS